jgi:hypothetical protein
MMRDLKRFGAAAALLCALTYVYGFALMLTVLAPSGIGTEHPDPATTATFFAAHHGLVSSWYLAIYVVNGLALAVLAVALWDRFRPYLPGLAQVALTIGALWATLVVGAGMVANVGIATVVELHSTDPAEAARLWRVVEMVENGLGGGNEIAGGVWAVLIGVAVLKTGLMARAFGWLSLAIGAAGLSTVLPALAPVTGAVFGLGYIAWFAWAGVALLRPVD